MIEDKENDKIEGEDEFVYIYNGKFVTKLNFSVAT